MPAPRPLIGIPVFVASVCLVILAGTALQIRQAHEIDVRTARTTAANYVNSVARHAESMLILTTSALDNVIDRVEAGGLEAGQIQRLRNFYAKRTPALPQLDGILVVDAQGVVRDNSLGPADGSTSIADRPYFRFHAENPDRAPHISVTLHDPANRSWVVPISRRIDRPDGSFGGIVVAMLDLSTLLNVYETMDLGAEGTVTLVRDNGALFARLPANEAGITRNFLSSPLFTTYLPKSLKGMFDTVSSLDGVARIAAYEHLESFPLTAVVGLSRDEVLTDWRNDTINRLIATGGVVAVLAVIGIWLARQMTEKVRAEAEAEAAAIRYRLLADYSTDIIVRTDMEGRRTYVSPASIKTLGFTPEELEGQVIGGTIHPDDRGSLLAATQEILAGASSATAIYRSSRKDGEWVWLESLIQVVKTADGVSIETISNVRDVSARKAVEADLVRAREVAEAATRSKDEFLANMSHEIRTPLNAIMGLTHLLLETEMTASQQDHLKRISRSSGALLRVLNDILDYSKIEAGRLELEESPFDLEDTTRALTDLFLPAIEEKGLEFNIEFAADVPHHLIGDPLRLGQILNNLVGNAVKFTEKGEIHLRVDTVSRSGTTAKLRFAIRDTGIGMSQPQMDRLFQPFTQADTSISRQFGGTGLGLTICRRLVELMGGEISLSSSLGKGSLFSFTVPFVFEIEAEPEGPRDLHELKTLIVDDQETAGRIIGAIISSWGGRATIVTDARAALDAYDAALAANDPYRLLLLDWVMPEVDGLELARRIAARGAQDDKIRPPTIIMVTAHDRDRLLDQAGTAPLDGILTKPVVPSTLFNTIEHAKARRGIQRPSTIKPQGLAYLKARPIQGAHILLVEDNALNQDVARMLLEKAGLVVTIADNGFQAIERIQSTRFDAVLMDLHMPGMDGLTATRRIRALPQGINLPILAMTAAAAERERQACLDAGMNDHIAKPIMPGELFGALAKWIQAAGKAASAPPPPPQIASARPEAFPEIFGIDVVDASLRLDGDLPLFETLLAGFLSHFSDAVAKLRAALEAEDLDDSARRAHTLMGAAANLSAIQVADIGRKLEKSVREKRNDDTMALMPQLEAAMDALLQAIRSHIGNAAAQDPIPDESLSDPARIKALVDALEANNIGALDLFAGVRGWIAALDADAATRIEAAIGRLSFSEALSMMREKGLAS